MYTHLSELILAHYHPDIFSNRHLGIYKVIPNLRLNLFASRLVEDWMTATYVISSFRITCFFDFMLFKVEGDFSKSFPKLC